MSKPADLDSIRLSLARIELEAMRGYFLAMASTMTAIMDMEDPRAGIPALDFLAGHENVQGRLDAIQELLDTEVAA